MHTGQLVSDVDPSVVQHAAAQAANEYTSAVRAAARDTAAATVAAIASGSHTAPRGSPHAVVDAEEVVASFLAGMGQTRAAVGTHVVGA